MWFLYLSMAIIAASTAVFSSSGVSGISTVSEAYSAKVDVLADTVGIAMRAIETKIPHNKNAFPASVSAPINIREVSGEAVRAVMPATMAPPVGFSFYRQADGKAAFSVNPSVNNFDLVVSRLGRDFDMVMGPGSKPWTDSRKNIFFVNKKPL